jgi:hypothetical protein
MKVKDAMVMGEQGRGQTESAEEKGVISTEIAARECGITRLYHYEPFKPEYLAAILREFRVHCLDPTKLNDPWDCRPAFDTSCLSDPDEARALIEHLQAFNPEKPIDPH